MSEYQYYEFQAIDRPLSEREMRTLRSYSTRARITPTSFVNHYDWGDFKGDEDAWMEKYFDAFLYVANWGTHVLKLRLPSKVLPLKIAQQYCPGGSVSVREKAGNVIITFVSECEPEGDFDTGEGWLASLVPIRAEIARGDLRALYLGWLLCVQTEELRGADREPPVPAGLNELSASLHSLVDFLRIDDHLLAAAAETSGDVTDESADREGLSRWVAELQTQEKDQLLVALMRGEGSHVGAELLARFRRERHPVDAGGTSSQEGPGRAVKELLEGAEERRGLAAKKAAEERARRERAATAARVKYLDGLAGREPTLWARVERLIAEKLPKSYDEAVKLLLDLRDLAARKGKGDFRQRIEALCAAHARKLTFIDRLKTAGL